MVKKVRKILLPGSVQLHGIMGKALTKTVENRLKKIDYRELVDVFRNRTENDGKWRGEFWGKIVRSTILAWKDTNDPELLKIIETTVDDLLSTQTADGCISTYPEEKQLQGWDLWGRKYVLAALLRYYEMVKQDDRILHACCRMADHLKEQLGNTPITDYGLHCALPSSSILTHLVKLYRYTGNESAKALIDCILKNGTSYLHNIYIAAAQGVPPSEIATSKAYEMTGCFEGLCEYLKDQPDELYRKSVLRYYEMVRDYEIFVTGTGGLKDNNGEFWYRGAERQTWQEGIGSLGETCVTVAWLHYCASILELTGDSRVADEMEKSFYNALLGAMHPAGNGWMHRNPTPLSGAAARATVGEQIPGFGGHDCCLAQGPEGIAMMPEFSFKSCDSGLVVNGYEPADCSFITPGSNKAKLNVTGGYPCSGKVKLQLQLEQTERFALKLRIPAWSKNTEICVGSDMLTPESGAYFILEREWNNGDEVFVSFDMSIRAVKDPGGSDLLAYCSGPLVLAEDSRLAADSGAGTFHICKEINGTMLCDYASAGNAFSPGNTLKVWLKSK